MTYPQTNTNTANQPNQSADREKYPGEAKEKLSKLQAKINSMRDEGSRLTGDLKKKSDENLMKLEAEHTDLQTKVEGSKKNTKDEKYAGKEASEQDGSSNFKSQNS